MINSINICIRLDIGGHIGMGHLYRCLVLADCLRRKNRKIVFLYRKYGNDGVKTTFFKEKGYESYCLGVGNAKLSGSFNECDEEWLGRSEKEEIEDLERFFNLKRITYDLIVVDHYSYGSNLQSYLRGYSRRVAVIDDLANRLHSCDLLIDQNPTNTEKKYDRLVPKNCLSLVGADYTLFRRSLLDGAKTGSRVRTKVKKILVFFGSYMPLSLYDSVVKSFAESGLGSYYEFHFVLGATEVSQNIRKMWHRSLPSLKVYGFVKNFESLLINCDLALGSGGLACLERSLFGLPSIIVQCSENQRVTIDFFRENKLGYILDAEFLTDWAKLVLWITENPIELKAISESLLKVFDGYSNDRVALEFEKLLKR